MSCRSSFSPVGHINLGRTSLLFHAGGPRGAGEGDSLRVWRLWYHGRCQTPRVNRYVTARLDTYSFALILSLSLSYSSCFFSMCLALYLT